MKELIEKIKGLVDKCNLIGMSLYGYDTAIDDVLEIIESHKPRWVDKPEPNGWYWIADFCNMDIQCVYVFETKFRGSLGGRFDIGDYKGKWQMANLPEME